ncbi:Sialic acid TRAP transporter permease protein SiaT [Rhizobiaceae bacterium]|nr:Sialic acid TRAP transporter permease protein SiaT [Rhizobiaceae bacterium]
MSAAFVVCLGVVLLIAALGAPVAYGMIVGGIVYVAMSGRDLALPAEQIIQGLYDSFVLLAVPLFIVAANIMNAGTISERLLGFVVAVVGRFRGGLGHVNVVTSIIFAGMSGSAVADAAGIGKLIINMMREGNRYPAGYAAAITAASSTIGPIIPPSIPMVLYALVSDQSVGYLFLGGILPGLLMGLVMMALNVVAARRRNFATETPVPMRELPRLTVNAVPALLMPVILLYGIYGGITTPTEAAAVAAGYALILAGGFYRALSFKALRNIMLTSANQSAAVGVVIGAALIFNYIVASENIPARMQEFVGGLSVSPLAFLIIVNIILLVLGCLLDASTLILVIIPLFLPACRLLGIDLVHFGVVAIVNCMIGLITPPYGIVLFVINAVTGIPLREIVGEILPFILVLVLALLLLILFPEIVLWLPRQFGYQS